MFIKIKSSSNGNENVRWIVHTEGMRMWGINGFTASGYVMKSDGTIYTDSRMNFRWNESDMSFESYNDLEAAKLACYTEMGYKPLLVKDMQIGNVFSVMYYNSEIKCSKIMYNGKPYILAMEGCVAGTINPGFITDDSIVLKRYKLTEYSE